MYKKIFSFLTLAAALLCSSNAWADVTSVSALQTALSGASGTVVLGADLDLGKGYAAARFTINNNIVLDLNNHKLSGGGQDYYPTFNLKSGSTLTITSNNGTGTIDMSLNGYNGHLFDVVSNSTLNLTSANVVYKKGWLLFSSKSGTINITAGSFNDENVSSYIDQDNYEQVQENDLYVVKALKDICTVGTTNYKKLNNAIAAAKAVTPYLPISLIENVTLTGDQNDELTFNGSKTLTVTGKITAGTYNCSISAGDGKIKGGLFATKPADAKIAEHYLCKQESGKWRVYLDPDFFVAKIGETKYASLEDAFAAAQDNDKIMVCANEINLGDTKTEGTIVSGSKRASIVVPANVSITLDMNGKTVKANGSGDHYMFWIPSGSALTVVGAGLLDYSATNADGILFQNAGAVTVNPGESDFSAKIGWQYGTGTGTTRFLGGKYNKSISTSFYDSNDYEVIQEGSWYVVKKLKDICTVGGTVYKKLSLAISASQTSGDPIILIDNVTTDKLNQDVTFGESTYTLTCSGKITAGTYKCPVVATAGMIQGGSFKYDPSQYVDTELFNVTLSEGLYTVSLKPGMGAVVIGDQGYMTLADAIAAVPTTGVETTLKLMMQIEESATIAAGQNIVLDLNSKSITKNAHTIFNNGTLTVTDNSQAKTGAIISTNSAIMCYSGSTTSILNGTIQGKGQYQYFGTITAYSGSHVYINGGTIVCNDGNHALLCATSNASDVVMSGGTLTYAGSINSIVYVNIGHTGMTITGGHVDGSFGGKTSGDSRVLLEGGEYTTYPSTSYTTVPTGYAIVSYPGNLYKVEEVYYQMTKGTCEHGTFTLSGVDEDGYAKANSTITITSTPDQDYKLNTYKVNNVAISGNSFTATEDAVVTAEFVAKDYIFQNTRTNVRYETLSDAVNSLVDNDTLKLLRNLNYAKTLQFDPLEKTFVIDMNGDTISGGDDFCIFQWMNGHITITNGTFNSSIGYAISSVGYNMTAELSNITLKDMTLIGSGLYCSYTNLVLDNVVIKDLTHYGSVWAYNSSVVTVKSGTYGSKANGAIKILAGCTLNIEGGSFGKDGSNNCIINNGTAHISGGLFAIAPTSDMLVSGFTAVASGDATYPWKVQQEGKRPAVTLGNIGTICLPSDVAVGDYTNATFYQIAYKDNGKIFFDEVDHLEAGKAYVFEPTVSGDVTYKMSGKVVDAPIPVNGLIGTFEDMNYNPDLKSIISDDYDGLENMYVVSGNIIQKCGLGCALPANRAYIDMNDVPSKNNAPAPAPGRHRISLTYNQVNTTTGVVDVDANANTNGKFIFNGQLIIVKDGKMFNAQGAAL